MSDKEEIDRTARELALAENCDVMIINGDIFQPLQELVVRKIRERNNKKPSLLFILATPGGSADSAYRISRAIQDNYQSACAVIAGWCKSAGTLCVIGAKDVVMFDDAELGPLDVQIARRDELGERDSGLVLTEALLNLEQHAFSLFENFLLQIKARSEGSITFKTATEISAQVTNGLFEPIYRQIDPQKIGEAARSLAIAEAYGRRLNLWARNLKGDALHSLTVGYPSHGFVIDRREADELFRRVREPNSHEVALINRLGPLAGIPGSDPFVTYLNSEEKIDETSSKNDGAQGVKEKGARKTGSSGARGEPARNSAT